MSSDNTPYEKIGDEVRSLADEVPFDIPDSWEWVRLGNIGDWGAGATPSRTHPEYYGGNIPWLKTGDLTDSYIDAIPETITELALEKTSVRLNPAGSVLIAMYGATIGKLGILNIAATTNQACCACLPLGGLDNKYLFYFLMAQKPLFIKQGEGGAQPNISKEKIVSTLMPVPPLEEQRRIVVMLGHIFPIIDAYSNTVDSLTTIRSLKERNVECYFEKENIWTFDGKGELLLTIMSSLAQEESRSISENCTWGQRKRFADGKVTVPFNRFLGYDMGPDHNLVVNPEQAKLVKRIYGMFLQGQSPFQIARMLTEEGIPSPGGKDHWNPSNIKSILTNEKYKGDALLQKTFTVDFLTKKKKANEGEIPQYYVKDNHEAIIDPETFEMVQTLMATRKKGRNRKSSVSIFSSKVKCGDCGSWYGPKVWHSNDAYRKVIWQCNHKFDGQKCATPTLTEDEIKELFLRAANQVIDQKEQFIAIYEQVLSRSLDTTVLDSELSDLEAEINIAAELIEECIKENAHVALDQAEYQKRYDGLVARFDKAKARHTEVTDLIAERTARRHQIETYLKELRGRELLTEFRETDWLAMVDYITVHSKDDIRVTFKDGTEIKA